MSSIDNSAMDLPDGSRAAEATPTAFAWLWLPMCVAVALPVIHLIWPEFYVERLLPEGYGLLEVSHFFVPAAGCVLAIYLSRHAALAGHAFWRIILVIVALACLYIAGEEHSWGQHFFKWSTPEYWSEINRQNETNLHNTSPIFDKVPRAILEIGILLTGIVWPLLTLIGRAFWIPGLSLFRPSTILLPTALASVAYKILSSFDKGGGQTLVARPSEAAETFYYYFILLFLLLVWNRLDASLATRR